PLVVGRAVLGVLVVGRRAVVVVDHGCFVEGVSPGENVARLGAVELAGPGADEDGGDGVACEVGEGAGFTHEAVDADDEPDAVDQLGPVGLQAARESGQACAGDARGALAGDDHEQQQADLFADTQGAALGGGDEQGGHGQVDGGPVEVEGVAGGHGDTDDGLAD